MPTPASSGAACPRSTATRPSARCCRRAHTKAATTRSNWRTSSPPSSSTCSTPRCCAPCCATRNGGAVEIIDFAPRWHQNERFYRPVMLLRHVRPLSGLPRIRIRLRPLADYGAQQARDHLGQQPHPLPGARLHPAPDQRRAGATGPRCAAVRARPRAAPGARPGRNADPAGRRPSCASPRRRPSPTGATGCATCRSRWNGRTR